MNRTDHNKKQISVYEYLPEVYKSNINEVFSKMILDRYFTKDDTVSINGYVGQRNKAAQTTRQLQEPTIHRQAYQLAPTMYTKMSQEETSLSFKHFLQQLELMGIDSSRIGNWAKSLQFNWIPPINIDMFVNYQDYYWDVSTSKKVPQYFTVEDKCKKSKTKFEIYNNILKQRGYQFAVIDINIEQDYFVISGDYRSSFIPTTVFYTRVSNNPNLQDKSWYVSSVQYDGTDDITKIYPLNSIVLHETVPPLQPFDGMWWYNTNISKLLTWDDRASKWIDDTTLEYTTASIFSSAIYNIIETDFVNNIFTISGQYNDIFVEDFIFFTRYGDIFPDSGWTTIKSEYDNSLNVTKIYVQQSIVYVGTKEPENEDIWYDPSDMTLYHKVDEQWNIVTTAVDYKISLTESLVLYQQSSAAICGSGLFDVGLFDDNGIGSVLWNVELLQNITHPTIDDWGSVNTLTDLALWYNPDTDTLYQYGDPNNPTYNDELPYNPRWNVILRQFSTVLTLTTGTSFWDSSSIIGNSNVADDWKQDNFWVHKSNLTSFAGFTRAQLPILEYSSYIEKSEWTEKTFAWKYRTLPGSEFKSVNTSPSRLELQAISNYVAHPVSGEWYIYLYNNQSRDELDIDYTNIFTPGYKFQITNFKDLTEEYTVESSEYRTSLNTDPPNTRNVYFITVIKILERSFSSPMTGGDSYITPIVTSMGDKWKGYHVHWCLDEYGTQYSLCSNQTKNIHNLYNYESTYINPNITSGYSEFKGIVSVLEIGINYQQVTISDNNVKYIEVAPRFQLTLIEPKIYASDINSIRVYINGIRQIGNFDLVYSEIKSNIPLLVQQTGSIIESAFPMIRWVKGVDFINHELTLNDVVRFEFGSASYKDMGMTRVPVRTIEDDLDFISAVQQDTQPILKNLSKYVLVEQTKTTNNQYPLFNVYDFITNNVTKNAPIFSYKEEPTNPINPYIGLRITKSASSDYEFEQYLVDFDDSKLYVYRDLNVIPSGTFWYSKLSNTVMMWNGYNWSKSILVTSPFITMREVVVSDIEPVYLKIYENSVWFNPSTSHLYTVYNGDWILKPNVIIQDIDPTYRTIWRTGKKLEEYSPRFVNKYAEIQPIKDDTTDIELPKQWTHNPEHKNKQYVKYSDLFTHFTSIIDNQIGVPGLPNRGIQAYVQDEYNYSVGGNIKEFNDGFDLLISAVNLDNVTPLQLIEFAQQQYSTCLSSLEYLLFNNSTTIFNDINVESTLYYKKYVIDNVIEVLERNDTLARIYGDTTAYHDGTGVRNVIATAPVLGLLESYEPVMYQHDGVAYIKHHDGHESVVKVSFMQQDLLFNKICSHPNNRTSYKMPPKTLQEFTTEFGFNLSNGVYWYKKGKDMALYRLEVYQVTSTAPSWFYNNQELPIGTRYYNTLDNMVYIKDMFNWKPENYTPYSIETLWVKVDILDLLGSLILEFETRLYNICKLYNHNVMNYDKLLITSTEDKELYETLYKQQFDNYVFNYNKQSPYLNNNYSMNNPWTYNYARSVVRRPPIRKKVKMMSDWRSVYNQWYNTPYPHLEPWKLQGYNSKPSWWDSLYLDRTGQFKWRRDYSVKPYVDMWVNIQKGIIPTGYPYPSGVISTGNSMRDKQFVPKYKYVSVNTSSTDINYSVNVNQSLVYNPDDLLPPYFKSPIDNVRSLFTEYNQVVSPEADYYYGSNGPIEWEWLNSAQYRYDKLIVAFKMQPVKFLFRLFGLKLGYINNLNIDLDAERVHSHNFTVFHGDNVNNTNYKANGINQWYVNYNRYTGFDTNQRFLSLWKNWTPKLTYQANSIIDTNNLSLSHRFFDIQNEDYNVILTNNGLVKDIWVDAFDIGVLQFPPITVLPNSQANWRFEINTLANVSRTVEYYGVRSYNFHVDLDTNVCKLCSFSIAQVNIESNQLYIKGDYVDTFTGMFKAYVLDSQSLSHTIKIQSVIYDPVTDLTRLVVIGNIDYAENGTVYYDLPEFPWSTGTMVVFSTNKYLPAPLVHDTPYYIIKTDTMNPMEFKVAETLNDSVSGIEIDFITSGQGEMTISEVNSSFRVFGGVQSNDLWYHYAIDRTKKLKKVFPNTIKGMQRLLNLIDGVSAVQEESNIVFDAESGYIDDNYGRFVDWQLETERFIYWAYNIRTLKLDIPDRYSISINPITNRLSFVKEIPNWTSGKRVSFYSSGFLPQPLVANQPYYIFETDIPNQYIVSTSNLVNVEVAHVTFFNKTTEMLYVSEFTTTTNIPRHEINPYRDSIVVDLPEGVLSNVVQGPYADIRTQNSIYDQYGNPITSDSLLVYRLDNRSVLKILPNSTIKK